MRRKTTLYELDCTTGNCLQCNTRVVSRHCRDPGRYLVYKRCKKHFLPKNMALDYILSNNLLLEYTNIYICNDCRFIHHHRMVHVIERYILEGKLKQLDWTQAKVKLKCRRIWNTLTTGYLIIKDMKFQKDTPRLDKILLGTLPKFQMKNDIGFDRETFERIFNDVFERIPMGNIKFRFHLTQEFCIKNKLLDKNRIKKAVYLFLSWMFHGPGDDRRCQSYNLRRKTYKRLVMFGGGILDKYFKKSHLLKTLDDIKKEQSPWLNYMLGVDKDRIIIFVDGIRWKISKSGDYALQHMTWSEKDKYNAFNVLGLHTVTGKCIMYAPEVGNASCSNNGDSYVWDMFILENIDGIAKLIPLNKVLGEEKGVILIVDKAWDWSEDRRYGGHTCFLPNISKQQKPERRLQANRGRLATMWRWSNEKCYVCFSTLWRFWRGTINTVYCDILGKLANICGALINFTGWGINKISGERMRQLYLMKMKYEQCLRVTPRVDYYNLLSRYRVKTSLVNGRKTIWKHAKSPMDIINDNDNTYWSINRLKKFILNDVKDDLSLLGGGTFSVRMAKKYAYHSRDWIGVYYSNISTYKSYIMIRNIKKKYSKFNVCKPEASADRNHHVLLYQRHAGNIIINTSGIYEYPRICLSTNSTCLGRHGKRDVSICGHGGCAYYYYTMWFFQKRIENPHPKASSYMKNMINADKWKKKYHALSREEKIQKHLLVRMLYSI